MSRFWDPVYLTSTIIYYLTFKKVLFWFEPGKKIIQVKHDTNNTYHIALKHSWYFLPSHSTCKTHHFTLIKYNENEIWRFGKNVQ